MEILVPVKKLMAKTVLCGAPLVPLALAACTSSGAPDEDADDPVDDIAAEEASALASVDIDVLVGEDVTVRAHDTRLECPSCRFPAESCVDWSDVVGCACRTSDGLSVEGSAPCIDQVRLEVDGTAIANVAWAKEGSGAWLGPLDTPGVVVIVGCGGEVEIPVAPRTTTAPTIATASAVDDGIAVTFAEPTVLYEHFSYPSGSGGTGCISTVTELFLPPFETLPGAGHDVSLYYALRLIAKNDDDAARIVRVWEEYDMFSAALPIVELDEGIVQVPHERFSFAFVDGGRNDQYRGESNGVTLDPATGVVTVAGSMAASPTDEDFAGDFVSLAARFGPDGDELILVRADGEEVAFAVPHDGVGVFVDEAQPFALDWVHETTLIDEDGERPITFGLLVANTSTLYVRLAE